MEMGEGYQVPASSYAICTSAYAAYFLHGKKVHLEVKVKSIGVGRCFRVLIYSGFLDWFFKYASSSPWEIWHLLKTSSLPIDLNWKEFQFWILWY